MGTRWLRRGVPVLTAILIVVVAILAGMATQKFAVAFDWTAGNRNSLTPASQRVLATLDKAPIRFTAYVYPGSQRDVLRTKLARYTRAASRVHLRFRDPARYPDVVRKLGIGSDGAVVVTYQGRSVTLTDYDEASVSQALMRLSDRGTPWVVFLTGHGERDPNAADTAGYQKLTAALDAQGLRVRTVNLAAAASVPTNTRLLVVASPQKRYLPGEVAMIKQYVARGGNLLWVDDPGDRAGLSPLADALGVHFEKGTLVYPDFRQLGTKSPAIVVVANYPTTPITRSLDKITLFPFAGALSTAANSGWHSQAFLRAAANSWLETGPLDVPSIRFQPDQGDQAGPQTIGLMATRAEPAPAHDPGTSSNPSDGQTTARQRPTQQRIAVVANSVFMDNHHLDQLGNRTLALSIFQWLAGRDDQIAIDIPKAVDARLEMAPSWLSPLRWLFVVALPLALLAIGTVRWLVRRRR